MKTLALVPARSGSKGIPGKNTRDFCGKPLLAWAVEIGKATCSRTFVTTDEASIGFIGAQHGAGVILRPKALATDEAPMLPVVQDALPQLLPWEPDVVVLLQPTQPLRTAQHVQQALWRLETSHADSVVSIVEIPAHYTPDFAMKIEDGCLLSFLGENPTRRQDCRSAYSRDGTCYAVRREVILAGSLYGADCCPFIIPHSESVNLDTEEDWERAEAMKERLSDE